MSKEPLLKCVQRIQFGDNEGFFWGGVCFHFYSFLTSLLPSTHCINGTYYFRGKAKIADSEESVEFLNLFFKVPRETILLKVENFLLQEPELQKLKSLAVPLHRVYAKPQSRKEWLFSQMFSCIREIRFEHQAPRRRNRG